MADSWAAFEQMFLGHAMAVAPGSFHAGPLYKLSPEEKLAAEELLLAKLPEKDSRHIIGLAALKSQAAVPELKQLLSRAEGRLALYIADSLNRILESDAFLFDMIKVLQQGFYEAAIELRNYPLNESVKALFEALLAQKYLVRFHAAESLLHLHEYEANILLHPEIFQLMCPSQDHLDDFHLKKVQQAAGLLQNLIT